MHVATISATICKAFNLDVDLTWAISLGHDFGHTPFGHVGEHILSDILRDSGGFNHELYSLYVVDYLINYGRGLDLTYAVRDGIINHCGEEFEQVIRPDPVIRDLNQVRTMGYNPCTWEGVVMRMSDKVAYLGRDLEDAESLGLVGKDAVPPVVRKVLGETNSEIIDTLVNDIISQSTPDKGIGFSDEVYEATIAMKNFNYEHIYEHPRLAVYHDHFERILNTLYDYLFSLHKRYGSDYLRYKEEGNTLAARFGDYLDKMAEFYRESGRKPGLIVADYIAGMTDDYAIDSVQEIMVPKTFDIAFDRHVPERVG